MTCKIMQNHPKFCAFGLNNWSLGRNIDALIIYWMQNTSFVWCCSLNANIFLPVKKKKLYYIFVLGFLTLFFAYAKWTDKNIKLSLYCRIQPVEWSTNHGSRAVCSSLAPRVWLCHKCVLSVGPLDDVRRGFVFHLLCFIWILGTHVLLLIKCFSMFRTPHW